MLNLLALFTVGAVSGWIYYDDAGAPAIIVTAQAIFLVAEAIGYGIGALVRRRRNGRAAS
jgi:hypothetical protein